MCCVCFENRNLSDHWQCYIPEGANRHGICDQCFQTYRSSSSRAHDCPVCRQPIGNTNYGEVAPPTTPPPTVYTSYSNTINPPNLNQQLFRIFIMEVLVLLGPKTQKAQQDLLIIKTFSIITLTGPGTIILLQLLFMIT